MTRRGHAARALSRLELILHRKKMIAEENEDRSESPTQSVHYQLT